MTQKSNERVRELAVDERRRAEWLELKDSLSEEELKRLLDEIQQADTGQRKPKSENNGRPRTRKWVLLH